MATGGLSEGAGAGWGRGMNTSISCPVCKKAINLEVDIDDFESGHEGSVNDICPRCQATLSIPVTVQVEFGTVRVVKGPTDEKFLAVQAYFEGRRFENRVEPWVVSTSPLPVQFIFGDTIFAKADHQGKPFVTDGYLALKVGELDQIRWEENEESKSSFANFLGSVEADNCTAARLVARIVGANFTCFHGMSDRVEDYAVLRDGNGRTIFLVATGVDAMLGAEPGLRFSISECGDFAIIRDDFGLFGVQARVDVDESDFPQLEEFGGVA